MVFHAKYRLPAQAEVLWVCPLNITAIARVARFTYSSLALRPQPCLCEVCKTTSRPGLSELASLRALLLSRVSLAFESMSLHAMECEDDMSCRLVAMLRYQSLVDILKV